MKTVSRKPVLVVFVFASIIFSIAMQVSNAQNTPNKTVVLVHGAFADGSSWDEVIPLLQAHGLNVVAVQNPLTSLADDVAATTRAIDAQSGSVILVGHSWGGVVITEAGNNPKVSALVYVAAFAPDEGQCANDLTKGYPPPPWSKSVKADSGGFLTLSADAIATYFAQDLPKSKTSVMAVTQGPINGKSFDEKVTIASWKNKPSWYIVGNQDHMIDPGLEQAMAKKINAKTKTLQSSHVPMLSKPKDVAEVILAAAASK